MDASSHSVVSGVPSGPVAAPPSPDGLDARLAAVTFVGEGLQRPECVLATASGSLYAADWRGGVAHLRPDGTQALYAGRHPDGLPLRPNGIALLPDGSFLLAQLGDDDGGVLRLHRDGRVEPWLMEIDGAPLPPTNFVLHDDAGRTWISVSTRRRPRTLGWRRDGGDGFVVLVDRRGARVVADGLGYANEVMPDPSGRWVYVNETFARRLSRFALAADGTLGPRRTVAGFGPGTYPDGMAFDADGGVWIVGIVANRLIRVAPDGRATLWLEDADAGHVAWAEAAYDAGAMDREHLGTMPGGPRLRNVSSLAFAGPDRRTGVLGCLLGDRLARLPMPVAGARPPHWERG